MDIKAPKGVRVKVRADHNTNGMIVPIKFRDEESETQVITKIHECRATTSLKHGTKRFALRYTVFVRERAYYLFYDGKYWTAVPTDVY